MTEVLCRCKSAARVAILSLAGSFLFAQPFTPGPQVQTFHSTLDDSQQPYALYLPRTLVPGKKYPLVVSLHAEETNHRVNLVQFFGVASRIVGLGGSIGLAVARGFPKLPDVDYIVACPFARGTKGYQGPFETEVYEMLADVEQRYPVDEDRVYLTGISMGGGGALWLALTRPDVWAAVAPVCAATAPGSEELAPNALNLPIRLFQGDQDPAIPAQSSRDWQRRLLDAGDPAEYIEYPGVRHNAWDYAYRDGSIFEWFAKFRRNPSPRRVRLVTRSYQYNSAYWVRIDGLTPGTLASIDARTEGKSAVTVETRNVDGFSLTGKSIEAPAVVTIDGEAVKVRAGGALSFVRTGGRWRAGLDEPPGKRPGAEGPIAAAVSGRQIYVYGTADNPPPEVAAARRAMAEHAAVWSVPRVPPPLSFPVKADSEVTAADIDNANLILFGTRDTNSLVARFAPQLPLALEPGAADYGLLFIAPLGKRYVLVNSGLPFWTGREGAARDGEEFAPWQYRLLDTFGDFILFRGSLARVVSEGRFDANWKLPPGAASKMLATGTVTIR